MKSKATKKDVEKGVHQHEEKMHKGKQKTKLRLGGKKGR